MITHSVKLWTRAEFQRMELTERFQKSERMEGMERSDGSKILETQNIGNCNGKDFGLSLCAVLPNYPQCHNFTIGASQKGKGDVTRKRIR